MTALRKQIRDYCQDVETEYKPEKENNNPIPINEWFESLYPWQEDEFIGATKAFSEVCLCAANQVGKTRTGTGIDACHALGDYPDGWKGHEFKQPPLIWCLGYSGEKTRDLLQTRLFGLFIENAFQGGVIPASRILDHQSMGGTAGAMRTVRVQWLSKDKDENGNPIKRVKGISTVQFWSYSQGQHALMGDSVDWFHIDEEPKDQSIYPQVITRTANGDNGAGGRGILTFTPENGRTQLVVKFMDSPGSGQCFIRKGWDDAPHLSESVKTKLLESYPDHQKDMRTKGLPMLGHGRIYDLSEEFITCDPFDIPDHFLLINGMDFGYDHPQAVVQIAIDMDSDIIYLIHAWKCAKVSANDAWGATKKWSEGVPTAWPHDGLQHEKGRDDALQQMRHYQEAGFLMLADHATWDGSSNSVEQGIQEIRLRMQTGRFKVFRGLRDFFDEFLQYHRAPVTQNGFIVTSKIVKVKDDVLDSCFHPDTKVITDKGCIKISELEGTRGKVLSVGGEWQEYTQCMKTKENAELIEVIFSDGYRVKCTPDHKFLTIKGWIEAAYLQGNEVCRITSTTTGENTLYSGTITDAPNGFYTVKNGLMQTGLFLKTAIFTTLTGIVSTTICQTLNVSARKNTSEDTITKAGFTDTQKNGLQRSKLGRRPKKERENFMNGGLKILNTFFKYPLIPVISAALNLSRKWVKIFSVPTSAKQSFIETAVSMTKQKIAGGVTENLEPTDTTPGNTVQGHVVENTGYQHRKGKPTLSVLQIRNAGESDVYCLSVPSTESFCIENGAIVHNCRYSLMMRRFAQSKGQIEHPTAKYIPQPLKPFGRR